MTPQNSLDQLISKLDEELVFSFDVAQKKHILIKESLDDIHYFTEKYMDFPTYIRQEPYMDDSKYFHFRTLLNQNYDDIGHYTFVYNRAQKQKSMINCVFVYPEYRNQHYGSILLLLAMKELIKKGASHVNYYITDSRIQDALHKWLLTSSRFSNSLNKSITPDFKNRIDNLLSNYLTNLNYHPPLTTTPK